MAGRKVVKWLKYHHDVDYCQYGGLTQLKKDTRMWSNYDLKLYEFVCEKCPGWKKNGAKCKAMLPPQPFANPKTPARHPEYESGPNKKSALRSSIPSLLSQAIAVALSNLYEKNRPPAELSARKRSALPISVPLIKKTRRS